MTFQKAYTKRENAKKKCGQMAGTAISAQKPLRVKKTSHAKKTGGSIQHTNDLRRMCRL